MLLCSMGFYWVRFGRAAARSASKNHPSNLPREKAQSRANAALQRVRWLD
jgi:hypothetical protein